MKRGRGQTAAPFVYRDAGQSAGKRRLRRADPPIQFGLFATSAYLIKGTLPPDHIPILMTHSGFSKVPCGFLIQAKGFLKPPKTFSKNPTESLQPSSSRFRPVVEFAQTSGCVLKRRALETPRLVNEYAQRFFFHVLKIISDEDHSPSLKAKNFLRFSKIPAFRLRLFHVVPCSLRETKWPILRF